MTRPAHARPNGHAGDPEALRDDVLLDAAHSGDADAFGVLRERYHGTALAVARSRTGSTEEAEGVAAAALGRIEQIVGEEIADQIAASYFSGRPQPSMMLNVSNIAWFGDSIALPQHLQISQMRSLETRRPMLRATNTGATAIVDARGRVQAQLQPYTRDVLSAQVQGMSGYTPYILLGNVPVLAGALLLLGGIWFARRRRDKTAG